jgi:hypothetical protein
LLIRLIPRYGQVRHTDFQDMKKNLEDIVCEALSLRNIQKRPDSSRTQALGI